MMENPTGLYYVLDFFGKKHGILNSRFANRERALAFCYHEVKIKRKPNYQIHIFEDLYKTLTTIEYKEDYLADFLVIE